MRVFAALLMLSACAPVEGRAVPGYDGVRYLGEQDAHAVSLLIHVWAMALHDMTGEVADVHHVKIVETDVPGKIKGLQPKGAIIMEPTERLSDGILAHELVHYHLRETRGDADAAHDDDEAGGWESYHYDVIEKANAEARRLGL